MTVDKRLVRRAVPYMLVVAVAIAVVVKAESETNAVSSRVTKVESPCLRYGPKSDQCKEAFEAAVATITHPEACAVERKAGTLRAIRELAAGLDVTFTEPCAGARLAQERRRGNERAATVKAAGPDTAASHPTTRAPHVSTPSHHGSTLPSAPHHPSTHPVHQPENSGSEGGGGAGEPGASQGSTSPPTESPAPPEDSGGQTSTTNSESVLESAGTHVGEVVNGAGELVETTTCGLTAPLVCIKR